ncbi:MAG: DUF7009 family protein [Lysobacter sp.]
MKLQLQGQRVRLRLDEAELARLLAGETIANATELGQGATFRQSLGLHPDPAPNVQAAPGDWRLWLPESAVRDYVARLPCREALGFELDGDGSAALSLRFEVDVRDSLRIRGPRGRRVDG